jgi:hypothetical protein
MTGVPLCTINAYFITYYQELKVQYYFMQVKYELLDLNELKFGECNLNSVWFLFLLNHNKYNFFFLDLQMLLKVVFGCVQGRRRMSRLYTLAHIRELPFLCV